VGSMGVITQIDATLTTITAASIPAYTKLLAGATRAATGAYFVGVEGGMFHYSGGAATQLQGLPNVFLHGVSMADADVWVVGNQGFVAKLPAGRIPASTIPTPDERWLISVYAANASDLWVVGRSGAILRGPPGVRGVDGGVN